MTASCCLHIRKRELLLGGNTVTSAVMFLTLCFASQRRKWGIMRCVRNYPHSEVISLLLHRRSILLVCLVIGEGLTRNGRSLAVIQNCSFSEMSTKPIYSYWGPALAPVPATNFGLHPASTVKSRWLDVSVAWFTSLPWKR